MESSNTNPENPFVHHFQLSTAQKVKMVLLGSVLLPLRLLVCVVCILFAGTLAYLGLYNLSDQEIAEKPFAPWRRYLLKFICYVLRFMFIVCGFKTTVIGEMADASQARILVVAPHSSFFDALAVVVMGAPSIVGKAETQAIPFWGWLIKFTQPVLVQRNDPNSRQNTIRQIVERSSSSQEWPQVLIFPEGTCTNRSCYIPFRPGAFLPGVPVQPVILRYENQLDTVTWTWEGIPAWKVVVYSLCQLYINCSIEFMEPYVPDQLEVQDAKLFAANVRNVMAERLGVPTTDCSYFDYLRIDKSQRRGKAMQRLQRKLEESLLQSTRYLDELEDTDSAEKSELHARIGAGRELAELNTILEDILGGEEADLRHFRLCVLLCGSEDSVQVFLQQTFQLFDRNLGTEKLLRATAAQILQTHLNLSQKEAKEALEGISTDDHVHKTELETFITVTKPNHIKVLKALENTLSGNVTDLLTKSASLTAERVAAKLEKIAASGSSLVSDMSATVAAGRDKVTVVLSSAVTSIHKRTGSNVEKKKD